MRCQQVWCTCDAAPNPRRRGQSVEPQAGSRRTEFAGYDVVEAQSGEEGLRVAQEDPPDLVLMDLQLPGIDGTETLRRLRQGPLGPTCRSSR